MPAFIRFPIIIFILLFKHVQVNFHVIFRRSPYGLSHMGSTSLISESNYSAITPEVSRKLSLSNRLEPKFSHNNFGFVSSKKDSGGGGMMPKPPRRTRSKDVPSTRATGLSRPTSRLSSSSRETTPVNQIRKVSQTVIGLAI